MKHVVFNILKVQALRICTTPPHNSQPTIPFCELCRRRRRRRPLQAHICIGAVSRQWFGWTTMCTTKRKMVVRRMGKTEGQYYIHICTDRYLAKSACTVVAMMGKWPTTTMATTMLRGRICEQYTLHIRRCLPVRRHL